MYKDPLKKCKDSQLFQIMFITFRPERITYDLLFPWDTV